LAKVMALPLDGGATPQPSRITKIVGIFTFIIGFF